MIWKDELKKIVRNPAIWGLLLLSLLLNGLLVWNNAAPLYEEVRAVHENPREALSQEFIDQQYSLYDTLDMTEILKTKTGMGVSKAKGSYKAFIDTQYEKLNQRVKEIKGSGEAEELVYPGTVYRLHSTLYVTLFRPLLMEMTVLTLLCILFLMDYERINKTEDVIYPNATGRKIQKIKWRTGLLGGLCFSLILMATTFSAWFIMIPYGNFWNTSISAALVAEPRGVLLYPFITFGKMTVLTYLLATALLSLGIILVIALMAGALWFLFKNAYFTFLAAALLLLGGLFVSTASLSGWPDIALSWNPAYLYTTLGGWFMENSPGRSFQGAEIINMGVQLLLWGTCFKLAYRKFER